MVRSTLLLAVTVAAVLSGIALFSVVVVFPMLIQDLYAIEQELLVHRDQFSVMSNQLWTEISQQSYLMRRVRSVQRKRRQYGDESYGGGSDVSGGSSNNCAPGPKGPPGDNGERGMDGDDGFAGLPGRDGDSFAIPSTSTECDPCPVGPVGFPGYRGRRGPRGPKGIKGQQGSPGRDGAVGEEGPDGDPGYPGDEGLQGEKGAPGMLGIKGGRGTRGPRGEPGPVGPIGDEGEPGERGDDGLRGDRGNIGPVGPPGKPGRPGRNGRTGNQGSKGIDGEYCECPGRGVAGDNGEGVEGGELGGYSGIADPSSTAHLTNSVILGGMQEGHSEQFGVNGGRASQGVSFLSRSGRKKSSPSNYRIPSITPFAGQQKTADRSNDGQGKDTARSRQSDDKSDIFEVFDKSDNGSPLEFSVGAGSSSETAPHSKRARAKSLRRKHL